MHMKQKRVLGLFAVAQNQESLVRGWKRQEPRRSAVCEGGLCFGVISRDTPAFKPVSASFLILLPMMILADDQTDNVSAPPTLNRIYRRQNTQTVRNAATNFEYGFPLLPQPDNGDEALYTDKRGSYGKGLVQAISGLVDQTAFASLVNALKTCKPADFDAIEMGTSPVQKKLHSPQAGLSYNIIGADSWIFSMPASPCLTSACRAGEMVELYWMALMRDVAFANYGTDPLAAQAIADLNNLSDFQGPKIDGQVTAGTLFRLGFPGDLSGPYVSQFLYQSIPFSGTLFTQLYQTPTNSNANEFMTTVAEWSLQQQGYNPVRTIAFDPTYRYFRNARDIGNFVHADMPQVPYINALMILGHYGNSALDQNNPYLTDPTQQAFAEMYFGQFIALLSIAVDAALHAAWYQKWVVHRALRPEMCAFLINQQITGAFNYGLHADVINSEAVEAIYDFNTVINGSGLGTYLLPQAYPEGCPQHPSYPAGHATVGGAAVTMLKAFFNENFVIPSPVTPNGDGTALVPYVGDTLTVGGELNKLASNIAISRNMAGVHYRSDAYESMLLGEQVAIQVLSELAYTWNINFPNGFSLTKFDGTTITVGAKIRLPLLPI